MEYYAVVFKGESLEHNRSQFRVSLDHRNDKRPLLTVYDDKKRADTYTISPGIQGYDTEYSRSKEADARKEYESAKKEIDVLVRNYVAAQQKGLALARNHNRRARSTDVKNKLSEYESEMDKIAGRIKEIIKKYPALKKQVPSKTLTDINGFGNYVNISGTSLSGG